MPTIQELHDLVAAKETQAGTSDRITGAEVRAVDNAIIDELPVRGVILVADLDELMMHPITECQKVIVPEQGAFAAYQTADVPDHIRTFPSGTPGYLWKRVTHTVVTDDAHEATNIVTHDPDDDKLKKSITLKTLTDWVIQNFEPRVPNIEDISFANVMGGFLHGVQPPSHTQILIDEAHNRFYLLGAFDTYKGAPLVDVARFYLDGSPDVDYNTVMDSKLGVYLPNRGYSGILFGGFYEGKLIIAGRDSMMAPFTGGAAPYLYVGRMLADGNYDVPYLENLGLGIYGGDGTYPRGFAIQPHDGKVIMGGDFHHFNGIPVPFLVRLNEDGTMDMGFHAAIGTGLNWATYTILVQPDRKIVFAGDFSVYNGVSVPGRLFRVNEDMTIDTAFLANIGTGFDGTPYNGRLQADGKMVFCGSMTTFNGISSVRVVRINADGTLDTAFAAALGTGANGYIPGIAIQADGKIIVGGGFTQFNGVALNRLARLNADGTLDTPFNTALGAGFDAEVRAIAIQSDGRILAAGSFSNFNGQPRPSAVVRLLPNLPTYDLTPPWSR